MTEEAKPKKNSKGIVECKPGAHTFIVIAWITSTGRQRAYKMMCQHCMIQLEMNEALEIWKVIENS